MYKQIYYPESSFGGFTDLDGTIAFYNRVNALLGPDAVVLNVGCGRGAYGDDPVPLRRQLLILKGKVKKVIGIDVDPAARDNPFVDEFHLVTNEPWPVADAAVDLILGDFVMEHIAAPEAFFAQCRRVLQDGGYLCLRTANRWSYVGLISRLIPNKFHRRVLARAKADIKAEDVFPTYYRANSIRKLRNLLDEYGFHHAVYGYEAEPSYLSFSRLAYFLGVLHQKLAPGFLRTAIFVFARLDKAQ
ncbi:MAG: methyltransferase domain-containing protein [Deltaproteobacteria bacterium]|nr:methyltransferase domain-containing protein [Deltaproteobacteria bacterium]